MSVKGEKWSGSPALAQLMNDIQDGTINPQSYVPKQVWQSREIYQDFDLNRFRANAARSIKQFINGKYNSFILYKFVRLLN